MSHRWPQTKDPLAGGFSGKMAFVFVASQSKIHQGYSPSSRLPSGLFPENSAPRSFQTGSYQGSASLKMLWEHETGVPDRLRSGDLLLERQACWLDYTTGTYMGTRNQTPGRSLPPAHTRRLSRSTIK